MTPAIIAIAVGAFLAVCQAAANVVFGIRADPVIVGMVAGCGVWCGWRLREEIA